MKVAEGVSPSPRHHRGVLRQASTSRLIRLGRRILLALVILTCLGTAMAEAASWPLGQLGIAGSALEIASNLRLQYLEFLAGATVILLATRRWRLSVLAGGAALLNLLHIAPLALDRAPMSAPVGVGAHSYRALLLNVWYENEAYDPVIRLVRQEHPDFLFLVEVTPAWERSLGELRAEYPYGRIFPWPEAGGLALLSRIPVDSVQRLPFGSAERAAVVARARLDGRPVTLIVSHPASSRRPSLTRLRQQQLLDLARYAAGRREPVLFAGDMNVTPWSPIFDQVLRVSGLRNGRLGFGALPTYPASLDLAHADLRWLTLLGVPLDHVLVSPDLAVSNLRLGPFVGSDHLPVLVDFSLAHAPEAPGAHAR